MDALETFKLEDDAARTQEARSQQRMVSRRELEAVVARRESSGLVGVGGVREYKAEGVILRFGDCLELLAELPSGCFDAVVTDPPYMIGAISTGDAKSKAGGWVDLMNASFWYRAWMAECWRALRDGGYMVIFLNWRTLPMLMKACADAKIETTSLAVWDKEWIGPAGPAQLRPTYEMMLFCGKGDARIDDRGQADVFRHKWMARLSDGGHAAAKPVPLLKRVIELVTKPGERVLDPFTGGGTTGIAAIQCGRRFEGYEGDEAHFTNSAERLAEAADPMRGLSSGGGGAELGETEGESKSAAQTANIVLSNPKSPK